MGGKEGWEVADEAEGREGSGKKRRGEVRTTNF